MSEYGLTPNGPNIKRLDAILDNMHTGLSKRWGVNTRQNPESFVNHMLTNIADAIAELWEFGEDVYYSEYPSFAEGRSLDNAAQFGGSTRETAAKSYYPIHCTGSIAFHYREVLEAVLALPQAYQSAKPPARGSSL